MSKEYREVAGKLGVKYLFGRWGIKFHSESPVGKGHWGIRLIPLNGWTFDPHEIIEAIANDPDMSISYSKKEK